MSNFEVVSDDRRRPAKGGSPASPLWDALRAGQTVFVPGATHMSMSFARTRLKAQGFRLHARIEHDPDGIVVWVERIAP